MKLILARCLMKGSSKLIPGCREYCGAAFRLPHRDSSRCLALKNSEATRKSFASEFKFAPLPADGIHGARRRHELRAVDLVPNPFFVNSRADRGGNLLIWGAVAKQ